MNPQLLDSLKKEFPLILEKSYDFSFDDGWYDLVRIACSLIKHHIEKIHKENEFKFTQLKEKFSGLRMYTEGYSDNFIEGVIHTVESLSFNICEVTGNKGFRCYKGGYVRTLSPEKMKELGFSPTKCQS